MIGKTISHYKILEKLGEGDIRERFTRKKAGWEKTKSIMINFSISGKKLTRV